MAKRSERAAVPSRNSGIEGRETDGRGIRRRALRGARLFAALTAGLIGITGGIFLYLGQEQAKESPPPPPERITLPPADDPRALRRGAHVSRALGACQGCHGEDLRGSPIADWPVTYAPALRGTTTTTPEELAAMVRSCRRPDGSVLRGMPCDQHAALVDSDLAAVLAWIRTAHGSTTLRTPPAPPPTEGPSWNDLRPPATAADRPRSPLVTGLPPVVGPELGAYLVATSCSSCHGPELSGGVGLDGRKAPALGPGQHSIDRIGLDRLLGEGIGQSDKKAHPTWLVASTASWTPEEVEAVWALLARPLRTTPNPEPR
jgi:mono/diheme cytochrome c family protein